MQTLVIEKPLDNMNQTKITKLNEEIKSGKHVFLFLFMVDCGPCKSTKETWSKMNNHLNDEQLKNPEIVVAMVDKDFYPKLQNVGKEPMGFPTLRYIKDDVEEYENAKIEKKDRSAKSFADWIKVKVGKKGQMKMKGGSRDYKIGGLLPCRKTPTKRRSGGKKRVGGKKWTLKYKRSINCKRPKKDSVKNNIASLEKIEKTNFLVNFILFKV